MKSSWILLTTYCIAGLALAGCARHGTHKLTGMSPNEVKVLEEDPFVHNNTDQDADLERPSFNADDHVGGIEGEFKSSKYAWKNEDSFFPVNEPAAGPACQLSDPPAFIRHCDPANYEKELKEAMERAAADPEKKTVVVRYSVSLGTPLDDTAFAAYNRTILRVNDDGVTPIPVGPATSLDEHNNGNSFHYFTDHTVARSQYVSGEKCYFNTVKIFASETGPVLRITGGTEHSLPATPSGSKYYDHTLNVLYYGDAYPCTGAQDCYRRYLSPRLFKRNDQVAGDIATLLNDFKTNNLQNLKLSEFVRQCPGDRQPQIIPLYVADFREQRFGPEFSGTLIDRDFANSATRRYEYEVKMKKIFSLRTLFWNRESMAQAWWKAKQIGSYCFSPYVGVAQLIDNIIFGGTNGTVLSTQYTPIVLDLPVGAAGDEYESNRHIHTSSVDWGTFFNLLSLMWKKPSGELDDIHHLTAWVGGKLVHRDPAAVQANCTSSPCQPQPPCTGQACNFPDTGALHYTREATDGFLVIPQVKAGETCSDGSPKYDVPRGENLFGSYAEVGGKFTEYNNGFQKLREWINTHGGIKKDCTGLTADCKTPLTADEMKARYFGPWDGNAWTTVKVWLDKNRDGRVDCGEIQSLKASKVAALNTCQFEYRSLENGELVPSKDKYGNATHIRAAFLVDETGNGLSELDTLKRIQSGYISGNTPAEFRVAIDVLFNSRPSVFLEDAPDNEIVSLKDLVNPTLP